MLRLEQLRAEILDRFERVDRRFAQQEQRIGRLDQRLGEAAERFEFVRAELLDCLDAVARAMGAAPIRACSPLPGGERSAVAGASDDRDSDKPCAVESLEEIV